MTPELWKKAERLFAKSVDLPADKRAALLDSACEGNSELRKAVENLLEGDAIDGSPLNEVIGRAAADLSGGWNDRWLGTQIGDYTIIEHIAEGGMGIVFLAERTDEQFRQQVAIKILATKFDNDNLRSRFFSERQILADLDHPNIARLLAGGETDQGSPYLVMEYIDGVLITEYCDAHRLPLDDRLSLFIKVCEAVHYAHQNLIIHRDIKPSNILVTSDGTPKLVDFGIAKLLDVERMPHAVEQTMDATRLLTPRHASPEQLKGQPVTTASDVYSLGLLLYELLCGEFPYEINASDRPAKIETTVATVRPSAPSTRVSSAGSASANRRVGGKELKRALQGDLDTIVLKALRKEPAARYGTARELAEDLQRFRDDLPISARPPTRGYLLSQFWKRNRAASIGIVTTLSAIVIGVLVSTVGFFQAREAERRAIEEAQNAAAISAFLVSIFEEANPDTSAGNERSVQEILALGLERVDTELADSPAIQVDVLETLSGVYKGLADYAQAIVLLERAVDIHARSAPEDLETLARLKNDLGDIHRIQSRRGDAAALIEEAIELYAELGDPLTDDYADTVNNLALVYQEMGRVEEARPYFEQALRLRQTLYERPHEKIALSLHNLSWHYGRTPRLDLAERYALEAIEMRVAVYGEVHPRVASTVSMLSRFYQQQDKWVEAEAAARRSVAIAEQIFDEGHPDLTYALYELASVLRQRGALREARDLFEQIVEWERITLGSGSHDFAMSTKAFATTLLELAEFAEAEKMLLQAQEAFLALPGSERGLESTRTQLGRLYIQTRQPEKAEKVLGFTDELVPDLTGLSLATMERSLAIAELQLYRDDPLGAETILADLLAAYFPADSSSTYLLPELMSLRAEVLLALERSAEAIAVVRDGIEVLESRGHGQHWRVALFRAQLGRAYLDIGDVESGRAQLELSYPGLHDQLGVRHPETLRVEAIMRSLQAQ